MKHSPLSIAVMLAVAVAWAPPVSAAETSITKEAIAAAHGLDKWGDVEAIRFNFRVKTAERNVTRQWEWQPGTDLIRAVDGAAMIEYSRRNPEEMKNVTVTPVDKNFINDSFWLLWPLHASWSADARLEDKGEAPDPLTSETRRVAWLSYPAGGGGYTPGDRYVLYLDASLRPTAWEYHKGGADAPSLVCSWEGYATAGPLTLSTEHFNADKSFHLWFENVSVKMKGDDTWHPAAPK